MTLHRYSYSDEDEIPSFYWHEEGIKTEHSIPIGASIVLDFADGRIVGFEIYDTNAPIKIGEEFQE